MGSFAGPDDGSLSVSDLTRIDEICIAFEASWRDGNPVKLESLIGTVPATLRRHLLHELLLLDVEYRFRRGNQPNETEYASRFPDYTREVAEAFRRLPADTAGQRVAHDAVTTDASDSPPSSTRPAGGLSPGDSLMRYTVLRELGHGGFGTVYLARDEMLRREVAIKIPRRDRFKSNEELEKFLDEARTAANLKHENIVPIHDVQRDQDGVPFVVMEYLEGDSLEAKLCKGQLTFEQIAEMIAEIADAVHYAHRKGVVHRDLKPSNIVFDANGRACITDFGLAERWEPVVSDRPIDSPALAGTSHYIPPEIYSGTAVMGPGIDVYALGVILYQALTGQYPYDGRNLQELQRQALAGAAQLPKEINPNVPERLQRICLKSIEPATHRYASALILGDELRRFLEGREVLARPLRYDIELRGKLQNHYAAIHLWREQNLISMAEMDRLLRPYWFMLQSDSPWPSLARLYPLESIAIRLGGWLVLLSTFLWPYFYWDEILPSWAKIASVAFPAVALNAVGWTLRYVGSRRTARIFLATGALVLPLLVVVILEESVIPRMDQGASWELFAPWFTNVKPSNMQVTIAAAVFLANIVFLLRLFPGKMFAVWLSVGFYVFFTGLLALCGLKYWIDDQHRAFAVLFYFAPCAVSFVGALVWDRYDHRGEAAMLYAFFPIVFALLLTMLGYYGSAEWLLDTSDDIADLSRNQTVNQWWMCNSIVYAIAAVLCQRATAGFIRFWSTFFLVLVPISVLLPCHLLFEQGWKFGGFGGEPFTIYEVLCGLAAVGFLVLGTATSRTTLSVPGLLGLAVFVFRFTDRHFVDARMWPLCVALVGGLAMLIGVAFVLGRARRVERHG